MSNIGYILIFAIVFTIILAIVLIKKIQEKQSRDHKSLHDIIIDSDNLDDRFANEQTTKIDDDTQTINEIFEESSKKDEADDVVLDGGEEGSFGVSEEDQTDIQYKRSKIKKDVPPHKKIIKENFKEFRGARILVAEDNMINQKVIGGLLADTGIELVFANDGQEVLDILQKDINFDMILMDAHMPRIDGFEATRQIRRINSYDHIVIVALSGDTASDDIRKMSEAGMEEFLEKPLKMDPLYDVMYAYIDTQKSQNRLLGTDELDANRGLEICGGDIDFYREILKEFVDNYKDSDKKLKQLLQNDTKAADKLLLDVVGISANIGAKTLSKNATKLREIIESKDVENYDRMCEEYSQHLSKLLFDIEKI